MNSYGGNMIQRTHFGDADIRTRHLFETRVDMNKTIQSRIQHPVHTTTLTAKNPVLLKGGRL